MDGDFLRIKGELRDQLERELLKAKIRNVTAQAVKTEFKTSIIQGEYISADDVNKKWAHMVNNVKSKLLSLHVTLAPRLEHVTAGEAAGIIQEGVKDVLNDLVEMESV